VIRKDSATGSSAADHRYASPGPRILPRPPADPCVDGVSKGSPTESCRKSRQYVLAIHRHEPTSQPRQSMTCSYAARRSASIRSGENSTNVRSRETNPAFVAKLGANSATCRRDGRQPSD